MTITVGIDSGSTATKGILLEDGVTQRRFLCPTPFRPADAIVEAWETLRAGLSERPFLTLTGYGRQLVDFADKQVTEISCHGLGARLLAPQTQTVIDIGGQDSKVIQLDEEGNLTDFLMNDKCAAGTGRFLEVISRTLGASVEQLDSITDGIEPHAITSMCTVFAESEVISLRSAGVPPEAILAGVINAMARRSAPMRFVVPSGRRLGPKRTSSRLATEPTSTRAPRGSSPWWASAPQWKPRPGASVARASAAPSMTASAPTAIALTMSPLVPRPPSAMTWT